jgi:hypothetical protein
MNICSVLVEYPDYLTIPAEARKMHGIKAVTAISLVINPLSNVLSYFIFDVF